MMAVIEGETGEVLFVGRNNERKDSILWGNGEERVPLAFCRFQLYSRIHIQPNDPIYAYAGGTFTSVEL